MTICPILTDAEYAASLAAISELIDADPARGTPEGHALEFLTTQIERYENERYPLPVRTSGVDRQNPPPHRLGVK